MNIALRYSRAVFFLFILGIMLIPSSLLPGESQEMSLLMSNTPSSDSTILHVISPIGISIRGSQVKDQLKVETTIRNLTTKPQSGRLEWHLRPRGKVQINPLVFRDLQPNDEITTQSGLMAGNKEAGLVASVELENGFHIEEEIGLMAIPLRLVRPKIDGSLAEWMDVPELRLEKDSQLVKRSPAFLWSKEHSNGIFQFWVTEEAFYIAANITDRFPLINPHHGKEIWRGDGIELFLGLKGPEDQQYYQEKDFYIGLSPGHKDALPEMWNWKTQRPVEKGEIVSRKTENGYLIEARIPFSEMGGWKPQRDNMIGFDVKMNNLDNEDGDKPDHSLIWSGSSENWRDSSQWGIAIIW